MNRKGGKKNPIKVWGEGAGTAQPRVDQRTDPEKREKKVHVPSISQVKDLIGTKC